MSGSATLEKFYNDVARDITDPESGVSVWRRLQLRLIADAKTPEERAELRQHDDLRIGALGFGSDFTVFLDRLGVPCLSLGFGGEGTGGVYHSIYDDFYWYTHFSDTTFVYGRALAQTTGTAVMRLADAELLPFRFTNFADALSRYLGELQKLLKGEQDEAHERDLEIEEGLFTVTSDPRAPTFAPPSEAVAPHLNFAPLENAAEALARSAQRYDRAVATARADGGAVLANENVQAVNATLLGVERAMLDPAGLPRRPWFKNALYAPGLYTGYDVKTVPMVREALEQRRWDEAEEGIVRTAKVLDTVAAAIDRASSELEKLAK